MTDYNHELDKDDEYWLWLDELNKERNNVKSCGNCAYSIKEEYLRLGSALFCYNASCSHTGGHWTSCSDARHVHYGLCGTDAKYFKEKMKEEV